MNKYRVTISRVRYLGKGKSEDYQESFDIKGIVNNK